VIVARRLWRSPALRFLALGAALSGLESLAQARRSPERAITLPRAPPLRARAWLGGARWLTARVVARAAG